MKATVTLELTFMRGGGTDAPREQLLATVLKVDPHNTHTYTHTTLHLKSYVIMTCRQKGHTLPLKYSNKHSNRPLRGAWSVQTRFLPFSCECANMAKYANAFNKNVKT